MATTVKIEWRINRAILLFLEHKAWRWRYPSPTPEDAKKKKTGPARPSAQWQGCRTKPLPRFWLFLVLFSCCLLRDWAPFSPSHLFPLEAAACHKGSYSNINFWLAGTQQRRWQVPGSPAALSGPRNRKYSSSSVSISALNICDNQPIKASPHRLDDRRERAARLESFASISVSSSALSSSSSLLDAAALFQKAASLSE